jgi:hypothetical protein
MYTNCILPNLCPCLTRTQHFAPICRSVTMTRAGSASSVSRPQSALAALQSSGSARSAPNEIGKRTIAAAVCAHLCAHTCVRWRRGRRWRRRSGRRGPGFHAAVLGGWPALCSPGKRDKLGQAVRFDGGRSRASRPRQASLLLTCLVRVGSDGARLDFRRSKCAHNRARHIVGLGCFLPSVSRDHQQSCTRSFRKGAMRMQEVLYGWGGRMGPRQYMPYSFFQLDSSAQSRHDGAREHLQ